MKIARTLFLLSAMLGPLGAQVVPFFEVTPSVITNATTPVVLRYLSNVGAIATLTNIQWDFGDGKIVSGGSFFTNATNFYNATNLYLATLTLLYDNGNIGVAAMPVNVSVYQPGSMWQRVGEPANLPVRNLGAFWVTPLGIVAGTGVLGGSTAVLGTFGSDNGGAWAPILPIAPYPPRAGGGYAMGGGNAWILGGMRTNAVRSNDVWSCADGTIWQQATPVAPWAGRDVFGAAYYHGRLWVTGGHLNAIAMPTNDVWSSADGATWVQHTNTAPWGPRERHTLAVLNDRLYLIGGFSNLGVNDVWSTQDGTNWVLENPAAPFGPRFDHRVTVAEGRIWMTGGHDGAVYKRDVWFSPDGAVWRRATGNAPWSPRRNHGFFYYKGNLVLVGGDTNGGENSEIWATRLVADAALPDQAQFEMNAGRWRLVGLPLSNAALNPGAVFSNLGASELWAWDPGAKTNGALLQYVRPQALTPTAGYWLLSEFALNLRANGTPPSQPAFAPLVGGNWNLLANPFPYPLDQSSLRITTGPSNFMAGQALASRGDLVDAQSVFAYAVQGAAGYVRINSNQSIPAGAGYWLWVHSNAFLAMPPVPGVNPVPPAYLGLAQTPPPAAPPGAVSMRLGYTAGDQIDRESVLTLSRDLASSSSPKPPAPRDHASLQLWAGNRSVSELVRPLAKGIQRYPFTVSGGRPGVRSTLAWDLAPSPGWWVFVRDLATGALVDASAQKTIPYTVASMGTSRTFEVVVAPEGTALSSLAGFRLANVALYPNPAPQGSLLTLRLDLDREVTLSLEIRDVLGRLRAHQERSAWADPWQSTLWALPMEQDGRPLEPGLYGWRLIARSAAGETAQSTGKLQITGTK